TRAAIVQLAENWLQYTMGTPAMGLLTNEPGDFVTRAEAAYIILAAARAAEMGINTTPVVFHDIGDIPEREAIYFVRNHRILMGTGGGNFSPNRYITVEEAINAFNNIRGGARSERHNVPWAFNVYLEPDFRAQRTGRFNPQDIIVWYINNDGWALMETANGENWVYLRANRRFVERRLGIFANIGDPTATSHVNPQVLTIYEQYGNWLLVGTWLGPKWLYLNYMPSTSHLDALLRRWGNNISVYFENLETGFIYMYNANSVYFSASVPKAFYALYIYQKAERGEVDLDSLITYTSADYFGGSGRIRHRYPVGTQISQRELLRLNLSYSDNIATLMLRRVHGLEGYRQFLASLSANPNHVRNNIFNSQLTVRDAGLLAREVFNYIESGGRYSEEFRAHLLNNQYPFIVSDYPVASKTGWTRPHAWHDMAIVYAPSPYILVILSRRDGWSAQDYRDFAEISMAFQEFNDLWFVR
ncbi:MAG: class A beta-lactamase-related serine hydrolase, partial [Defluviitaleaceae bacterium]|nr:class A beta-lactamase-related serine hydrolase [Defluviitaleaceae bacterium]